MMKSNYIYIRVSTNRQKEKGYSINAQINSIKEYCASKGIVIDKIIQDGGYSGSNLNRPGIERIINDIKKDNVNYLVIWNTSRLTRSMKDYIFLSKLIFQHGVTLDSVTDNIDTVTASGKLLANIKASFNEYEVNNMKERIRLGSDERAKSGYSNSGFVLGYDCSVDKITHKRCLTVNKSESEIVKLIFKLFISGNNMSKISSQLNKMGFRTKNGNKFHSTSISNILNNKLYIGKSVYGKYKNYKELGRNGLDIENIIDTEGNHSSIINVETWNKAQKIIKASYGNSKVIRPLVGILRCPQCDGKVKTSYTKNKDKLIRYYSCKKGASVGCHANSINAQIVEHQAILQLIKFINSKPIQVRLLSLIKKFNNKNHTFIKNIILNQSSNIATYKNQLSSLEKASKNDELLRKELSKEIETLKDNISESRDNIDKYKSKYSDLRLIFGNYESFNLDKIMKSMFYNQNKNYFRKLSNLVFESIEYNTRNKLIEFNFKFNGLESKIIRY